MIDLEGDSPSATMTGRSVPILNFPATKHFIGFISFKADMARLWSRKEEEGVDALDDDEDEDVKGESAETVAEEEEADEGKEESTVSAEDKFESEARWSAWTKLSALSNREATPLL